MIPSAEIIIAGILVGIVLASSLTHFFALISQDMPLFSRKVVCESCGVSQSYSRRIPIIASLLPGRKCSACGHEPTPIYVLLELAIVIFSAWAFIVLKPILAFQISVIFFALIGVTYMDLKKWIIPNEFVIIIFAMGVLGIVTETLDLNISLLGLVLAAVVSLLIVLPQRFGGGDQTLALGDVKLCLVVALWLGWILSAYVFFVASLMAFITWIFTGIFRGFSVRRRIPFGPFVALSTMIFGIGRVVDPQFVTHLLTFRF